MRFIEVPVSEVERRKNHMDLIDPNHSLPPIATTSLNFHETDRPSNWDLCQQLAGLKESEEYRESVLQHRDLVQAKDNQISVLAQQLECKEKMLREKGNQVRALQHKRNEIDEQNKCSFRKR